MRDLALEGPSKIGMRLLQLTPVHMDAYNRAEAPRSDHLLNKNTQSEIESFVYTTRVIQCCGRHERVGIRTCADAKPWSLFKL